MSVIFEGVDGVGKTTEAKGFLAISPGHYYVHNWAKPTKDVDIISEVTKELLLLQSPEKIIFDRSFIISEYVYSHVLGRKSPVTMDVIVILKNIINLYDHTLKLFTYSDITDLRYKEHDKHLPFDELNNAYTELIINQLDIKNLLLENISKREVIYENNEAAL